MADFTSALYLGLRHAHGELPAWRALTLGAPSLLRQPDGAAHVCREMARLAGLESAAIWPSSLHAFLDVLHVLAARATPLLFDGGAYPISRWAAGAAARGIAPARFEHFDPASLRSAMGRLGRSARRPIVVTDGLCVGCGRSAPLEEYIEIVEATDGLLVVDDTQAVGVLGARPRRDNPLGEGGGGSLRRSGLASPRLVWVASLAKGFGAPLSVVAGSRDIVSRIARHGPTRAHSSPPSAATVAAAGRALALNRAQGESLRRALASRVRALRSGLLRAGFPPEGGAFPVQRVALGDDRRTALLHGALRAAGAETVLTRASCTRRLEITFLVTVTHTMDDIRSVESALGSAARRLGDVDDGGWSTAANAGNSSPAARGFPAERLSFGVQM